MNNQEKRQAAVQGIGFLCDVVLDVLREDAKKKEDGLMATTIAERSRFPNWANKNDLCLYILDVLGEKGRARNYQPQKGPSRWVYVS